MSELSKESVYQYLEKHVDFLLENPELLGQLNFFPEPLGTTSLVRRQHETLRDKNQQLQTRLASLIDNAQRNEAIFLAFSACHQVLHNETDFDNIAEALSRIICHQLDLSECRLVRFEQAHQTILKQKLSQNGRFLGELDTAEKALLFNHECRSAAVYLIGSTTRPVAIWAFASQTAHHFQPQQGNLFVIEFIKSLEAKLAGLGFDGC